MKRLKGTGLPHFLGDCGNDLRVGEVVGKSLHAVGGEGDADDNFDDQGDKAGCYRWADNF